MDEVVTVTLGRTYSPDMWELRKRVTAARKLGAAVVFVDLRAPINSQVIRIALRSSDLYLIGIRTGDGRWHEFAPDTHRSNSTVTATPVGLLPGSRWIMVGSLAALSSYRALGLPKLIALAAEMPRNRCSSYSEQAPQLVDFFCRQWNGRVDDDYTRLRVCVLIFILCEALRFRSIESAAADWIVGSPRIPAGTWRIFEITREMLDKVQSWAERARNLDPDVQTWLLDMPDSIID